MLVFLATFGCLEADEKIESKEKRSAGAPIADNSEVDNPKTEEDAPEADDAEEPTKLKTTKLGWLGEDSGKNKASIPSQKQGALAGQTWTVKDVHVTKLKLQGELIQPNMLWSSDGEFVFVLSEDGVLRKVAYPGLEEEAILETKETGGGMRWSQLGLLVGLPSVGQIWLIDSKTLEVKKKITAPNTKKGGFASSPQSKVVYVSDDRDEKLIMIDLQTGEPIKEFTARDLQEKYGEKIKKHLNSVLLSDFTTPAVTPDGKYLFCEGFECLHRFKISGEDLIYEEMGPRLGSPDLIFISRDSQFVEMCGYLYRVSDIGKPLIQLEEAKNFNLDSVSKNVYAGDRDQQLIIYTETGLKRQGYILSEESDEVRQILAHPEGGQILVLTKSNLLQVKIPTSASEPKEAVKPKKLRVTLAGKKRKIKNLQVTEAKLSGELLLDCMQWSPERTHVYLMSSDGLLRKVSYPSLEQELTLETGALVTEMQWSKLGLLIGLPDLGEIWIVDSETLEVKKKIIAPITKSAGFTSSQASSMVYIVDKEKEKLIMIDLETGQPVKEFSSRKLSDNFEAKVKKHADSSAIRNFTMPTLTPDGQHLICESHGSIHRLKVTEDNLYYEEVGPNLGSNLQCIFVDQDSHYVAMLTGRHRRPEGHPHAGNYSTYVYRISDLGRPVITMSGEARANNIALDKATKNVYLSTIDFQLILFSAQGEKKEEYVLTKKSDDVRQYLVHPSGGKLLVLTDKTLVNVDFSPIQNEAASSLEQSFEDRLKGSTWAVHGNTGQHQFSVKFSDDGVARDLKNNKRMWRWKIAGETTLHCQWFSSGWVKFDVGDKSSTEFAGVSKRGQKYHLKLEKKTN